MSIWLVPSLFYTGVVLLLDFILRRRKWSENTRSERNGLVLTMVVSFPYTFCSYFGLLMGILGPSGSSPFMLALYKIVIAGGFGIAPVCLLATVASLVLRKRGRSRASNRALVAGLAYCGLITVASFLV